MPEPDLCAAFLADILARPGDDTPRLVFADWLEEYGGDPERAEFIRVQCWLVPYAGQAEMKAAIDCGDPRRYYAAVARERELLRFHGTQWADTPADVFFSRGFVSRAACSCKDWLRHGPALVRSHPLERVEISDRKPLVVGGQASWLRSVRARTPRSSMPTNVACVLPYHLFDLLPAPPFSDCPDVSTWHTAGDANDALSTACLRLAREKRPRRAKETA